MNQWYKKDFFRNLVDMHIPNGEGYLEKFDPAKYAANIKRSGASVAYIYGSNCLGLCFFPTKLGRRHKAAERDIFGQTVQECRKLGLDVVGYLNSWGSFVCDDHPEWSTVPRSGISSRSVSRFGNPCPNNPEYANYFVSLVKEFASMYALDGLWIDMVGIWQPVCHCEACQKKFMAEYGKPIPDTDSLEEPGFMDYIRFKGKSIADYAERIRQAAKEVDPELTISIQAAPVVHHPQYVGVNDMRYTAASDYLAGDFNASREDTNMISRLLYKLTPNLPFEFMTARCVSLERHTMNKNAHEMLNRAYASMMYKGAFLFIDAIDPDGEMDTALYDQMAWVSQQLKPYLPYATDYTEVPLREIAVYYNVDSFTCDNGKVLDLDVYAAKNFQRRLNKISSALSNAGLDYDIISPKNLQELDRYKVLILSSMETFSEAEAKAVREFVQKGGRVYISGSTSLRDEKGILHENFMLSDLMGVDYAGKAEIEPCYLAPEVEAPELFGGHSRKYPHMLDEKILRVRRNGQAQVLATLTLPVSDTTDFKVFSSAISNPPIVATLEPTIVENSYGAGKVIYSAGVIEEHPYADNCALFAALVKRLQGEAAVTLTAPSCVDYSVYQAQDGLRIHLLNSQTIYPPIHIEALQMTLKLGGKKVKQVTDLSGGILNWKTEGDLLQLETDLQVYKLITVETE